MNTRIKARNEDLPPIFDYPESTPGGNDFFVSNRYSIADIAPGCQLTRLDIVAGTPDDMRWPGPARHTGTMKTKTGIAENPATCHKMLSPVPAEPVNLS